jgi:hypothetical protein
MMDAISEKAKEVEELRKKKKWFSQSL